MLHDSWCEGWFKDNRRTGVSQAFRWSWYWFVQEQLCCRKPDWFKPTAKEVKTWEIAEDCDVVVWNTSNCHIYTIKVKAPAAAAAGYTVSLKDGVKDADKWSVKVGEGEAQAFPVEGLEGGEKITVTYSGEKKVKSVKAVKKAAAPAYTLLSAATAEDIGKVVCAAGHLHDAKTAVPDGCTAVGILGKVTSTGHGLILALQDAKMQTWNTINGWTSASYAGTTLKVLTDAARGTNLTSYTALGETAVSNWAVAQKSDYEAIFTNIWRLLVNYGEEWRRRMALRQPVLEGLR